MRQFIINFHENITQVIKEGQPALLAQIRRLLPVSILFMAAFSANSMLSNGRLYLQRASQIDHEIQQTLESLSDSKTRILVGPSFETIDGMVEKRRVYGERSVYRFYFNPSDSEDFVVFDEQALEWLGTPPEIPPMIAKAFIYHDIGLVDSYTRNGEALIDGEAYDVVHHPILGVTINDTMEYRPLPPLATRVETFIQQQLSAPLTDLTFLGGQHTGNQETLFLSDGTDRFQLIVNADDSARITTIIEDDEPNK